MPLSPLSSFGEEIVTYIAGWISRKMAETLKCGDCRKAVLSHDEDDINDNATLIRLRDQGGLLFPSSCLKRVCDVSEGVFRQEKKPLRMKIEVLQGRVHRHLQPESLFSSGAPHFTLFPEHLLSLFQQICKRYFVLRKFQAVRLLNNESFGKRTRFVASKNIIFRGE
jgi:hypothetical protein